MPFILEQSHSESYASAGGMAVVGPIINRHSGLKKRLKSVPLRHGIAHIDLICTYLGLLCQGKNDFEAAEGIRDDVFFQHALGIARLPSSARLRQRFDEQAVALTEAADDCLVPLLSNLKAPISALPSGHVALHADVFCLDNGKYLPAEYTRSATSGGPPWCASFVSWALKQVFGRHLLGRPVASVHTAWGHARKADRWEVKTADHVPTPGDAFVILKSEPEDGWCQGHIGFVLQVAGDGESFNTVEGNCGNRVKIGRRNMRDPTLRGFIKIVGDQPEFARGSLRGAKNLGRNRTR